MHQQIAKLFADVLPHVRAWKRITASGAALYPRTVRDTEPIAVATGYCRAFRSGSPYGFGAVQTMKIREEVKGGGRSRMVAER